MDRGPDWVFPTVLLCLLAVLCVFVIRAMRKQSALRAEETKRHEAIVAELAKKGRCDEHGTPLCAVCGEEATEPMPYTAPSWLDRWIGRSNQLHGVPWRYTIADDYAQGDMLCARHKRAAVQRLEQTHAELRHDRATFNAQQQARLARLEGGELIEQLLEFEETLSARPVRATQRSESTLLLGESGS